MAAVPPDLLTLKSPPHLAPRAAAPHKQRRGKGGRDNSGRGGEMVGRRRCCAGGREERRTGRREGGALWPCWREGGARGRQGMEGRAPEGMEGSEGCGWCADGARSLERISIRRDRFAVCYRSGTRQTRLLCRVPLIRHTAKNI